MTPYRHLLVGIDLDPNSGHVTAGSASALDQARWLAGGPEQVRCTLLHSAAADEFQDADGYRSVAAGATPRDALEQVREELEREGIATDVEIVTEEHAWLAITRSVLQGPCDLVIAGKRSHEAWEGPLIGSEATKLLRKCPCAVWLVRPGAPAPPRRVLAAADLSAVGERVVERASQLAQRAGADLHAVHAIQYTMAAQLEAQEKGYVDQKAKEVKSAILAGVRAAGFEGEPELHVGLTSPTRAILGCVDRYHPDLVVMGTVSRGGVAGLLVGNTAERLLPRLDTSLLTVKPADFVCPVSLEE